MKHVMIMLSEIMPQYPMTLSYDIIIFPRVVAVQYFCTVPWSFYFPLSCSILSDFYGFAALLRSTLIEPFAHSSVPVHFM